MLSSLSSACSSFLSLSASCSCASLQRRKSYSISSDDVFSFKIDFKPFDANDISAALSVLFQFTANFVSLARFIASALARFSWHDRVRSMRICFSAICKLYSSVSSLLLTPFARFSSQRFYWIWADTSFVFRQFAVSIDIQSSSDRFAMPHRVTDAHVHFLSVFDPIPLKPVSLVPLLVPSSLLR